MIWFVVKHNSKVLYTYSPSFWKETLDCLINLLHKKKDDKRFILREFRQIFNDIYELCEDYVDVDLDKMRLFIRTMLAVSDMDSKYLIKYLNKINRYNDSKTFVYLSG